MEYEPMAESINFSKEKVQYFLDCLANGKPIEGPWSFDNMMMLAGALLFVVRSQGSLPQRIQREGGAAIALEQLPAEFLISTDQQFIEDSASAVEFYAHLAEL